MNHTEKKQQIRSMLETYEQALSEPPGGEGGGGNNHRNDSRYLGFDPTTWGKEYRELQRCLDDLRALAVGSSPILAHGVSARKGWWSLRERYLTCAYATEEVRLRKTRSGDRVPVPLPANKEIVSRQTILNGKSSTMRVRVWNQGVDPHAVSVALDWVTTSYRGRPAGWIT